MNVCIFLGPTLPLAEAREYLPNALYLPPVQHGDVYSAVQQRSATVIGIIDGYFQHRASVWHKEILWALNRGIAVYGASSMGALRAAELHAFGMSGVGRIYDDFLAGALPPFDGLTDDDEVAVTHGPAETGYIAVSDALVNIRHTLNAAVDAQRLDQQTSDHLLGIAKKLHFSDRSYNRVLKLAREAGVNLNVLDALSTWLETNKVDQKRLDAVSMLQLINAIPDESAPSHDPGFRFETTEIWRDALPGMLANQENTGEENAHHEKIVDELRLHEFDYIATKQAAMAHQLLNIQSTDTTNMHDTACQAALIVQKRQIADTFRQRHTLLDRESIDAWLAANDMSLTDFDDMVEREARIESASNRITDAQWTKAIVHQLRLNGHYPELSTQAARKSAALQDISSDTVSPPSLLRWFFEERQQRPVPEDLPAYVRKLGLETVEQFVALLQREYHYLTRIPVDK